MRASERTRESVYCHHLFQGALSACPPLIGEDTMPKSSESEQARELIDQPQVPEPGSPLPSSNDPTSLPPLEEPDELPAITRERRERTTHDPQDDLMDS